MRKLGIALVIVLALAVAADFGVKFLAQRAVAVEMASSLQLDERPDVSISSFPFIVRFLSGELRAIELHADDVGTDALDLASIDLEINDVTFEPREVIGGDPDNIRTSGGSGTATFTDDALTSALRRQDAPLRVVFDGGEVTIRSAAGSAGGSVDIGDGRLIVSAGGDLSSAVALPSLGGRVTFESLDVGDGEATLGLSLAAGRLRL